MAIIFVRSSLIYIFLLIIMRFMGKRQIGEMQPFEFVVTLLIAELACIPMSDVSIPLLYGISAIIAVFILHQVIALIEQSGAFMKFLVSGKPSLVITKKGVDFKELKKNNMDVSDLIESLRGLGYFGLNSVNYALYESNGTLSAVPSNVESSSLPIILIKNGKYIDKNLQIINKTSDEISEILKNNKVKLNNVGVFTINGDGEYYLQEYKKKFITGKITIGEDNKW